MLNNPERQDVTEGPARGHASKLARYAFLVLALTSALAVENPLAVRARAGVLAVPLIGPGESTPHFTGLARGVRSVRQQRGRRRRRSVRRRVRRPHTPATSVGATQAGRMPAGAWGGEHIALQSTESGATFEIDCAHGSIEGLLLDAGGRFSSRGVYVREHGGPEREGQRPDTHPALFTGWSDGKRMTLKITLTDTGQVIGDFDLTLGSEPRMTKCL